MLAHPVREVSTRIRVFRYWGIQVLRAGSRSVNLALAAAPLDEPAEAIGRALVPLIRWG